MTSESALWSQSMKTFSVDGVLDDLVLEGHHFCARLVQDVAQFRGKIPDHVALMEILPGGESRGVLFIKLLKAFPQFFQQLIVSCSPGCRRPRSGRGRNSRHGRRWR